MANRFPLVVDTLDNNKIKELPSGDNLQLSGNSIIGVIDITGNGTLTINNINAGNISKNGTPLASVATSGSYSDLVNTPTNISTFVNDSNYLTNGSNISLLTNDVNYLITGQAATPEQGIKADNALQPGSNISLLINDLGYITLQQIQDGSVSIEVISTGELFGSVFGQDSTILVDGVLSSINLEGTIRSNVIPFISNVYDIGSSETYFKNIYGTLQGDSIGNHKGSVFSNNNTLLVDSINSKIVGDISTTQLEINGTPITGISDDVTLASSSNSNLTTENAVKGYVDNSLSALIGSSPTTLNTLNELAAALGDDPNFATTITSQLGDKANIADLATVATTGSYTDLSNPPSIPSTLTDLSIVDGNDGDVLTTDGLGNFTFQAPTGGSGNVFVNINADTGTTTANTNNDTLTISGGTSIDTEIVGDTLTINFNGTIPTDVSDLTDTTSIIPASLTDLEIVDGEEGDVLTTDGLGNFTFQAPTGGGGATTLDELTDVSTDQPNDGDGIFYNSSTGNWEASAPSGGGTSLGTRQVFDVTTFSIPNNSTANATILTNCPGYILYKVETDAAAWVRLYTDENSRLVDSLRLIDEDPINVSGLIAEVVTVGAQTVKIAPGVIGFNDENPVANEIPITVENQSGSTRAITVRVTLVQIEA